MDIVDLGSEFWSWVLSDATVDEIRAHSEYARVASAVARLSGFRVRVEETHVFDDIDSLFATLPDLLRAAGRGDAARRVERFVDRVRIELMIGEMADLAR